MRRLIALFVVIAAVVSSVVWFRNQGGPSKVLRVVTWSGYFSDAIVAEFTKKTGIEVEFSYISSNEELFSKLKAGASGYDLIQPSDYMVEQMIKLSMIQPIKKELLPHFSHLDSYYLNLPYDPGLHYTIPFVRGTTGIVVNTEKVKIPESGISWDLLFNSPDPTHTSLLDDMREVNSAILFRMGKSPNTEDKKTLQEVYQELNKAKSHIALFSSEPLSLLLRGDITIAHAFSTHGIQANRANPKLKYFLPKEGNTVWTDNFAIPSGNAKVKEAHIFMDYFLDPVNALAIVQDNHLATPNLTARRQLSAVEQKDAMLYPSNEELSRMQFLRTLNDGLMIMSQLWTEIKSN